MPSYNPFTGPRQNADYHTLRTIGSVRRLTSGEAHGSPLGPRRSAASVPALVRPKGAKRVSLEIDDRRRTSESFLWENEPMSAAAMLGNSNVAEGKSVTKRSSSKSSLDDAASCLWQNEPMSAAASLASITRTSLPCVSESEQTPGCDSGPQHKSMPRLAINTAARHMHHTAAWRPRRPAPSPPQRANSFPSPQQNEDFLEYDITNSADGLTLQETPRSSHRDSIFKAPTPPVPAASAEPTRRSLASTSELAQHHNASQVSSQDHVTSALNVLEAPVLSTAAQGGDATAAPTIAHLQVHDASTVAAAAIGLPANNGETVTASGLMHSDDSIINRFIEDALQLSRRGSVATLYESAHSGSVGLPDDVFTV